jgi:hypothetical protein
MDDDNSHIRISSQREAQIHPIPYKIPNKPTNKSKSSVEINSQTSVGDMLEALIAQVCLSFLTLKKKTAGRSNSYYTPL